MAAGIAGAALALAIPSAVFAVNLLNDGSDDVSMKSFASFTPAISDPRLIEMIESRSGGKARMKRFTPAGVTGNSDRAITVAVRVDEESAKAISVRSAIASVREQAVAEATPRVAQTRYNLGLARGYHSFAQAPVLAPALTDAAIPDLSQFEPSPGVRETPSRFAARIALAEEQRASRPAPQTFDALTDQSLDVAGSYRLTRNIDVTAGVRYQQERDRLSSLPSIDQQDSQAVYIGTQFRF
nr:hypothetical protein [Alteraurantiacibacter aestuarii]